MAPNGEDDGASDAVATGRSAKYLWVRGTGKHVNICVGALILTELNGYSLMLPRFPKC